MASIEELFEIAKIPKGKNSIESANEIYDEKKHYYEKVYPSKNLPWMDKPFDFVNENPLYGKVNLNGDYIIPKTDHQLTYKKMINIGDAEDQVFVFDFIADAFKDLKANIKTLVRTTWLSSAGPIADFTAKKGTISLGSVTELQKKMHYFIFVTQFLSAERKEKISNISDFINLFLKYLKTTAPKVPFTKSAIINAHYMSPLSTGLCVEIDTKGYDEDEKKHKFLTDPNFNVYRIIARRFGFMIDRNVPWRLVADIKSLKMREYMRIAYEKDTIQKRQEAIIDTVEAATKSALPDWPTTEGIANSTYKGVDLKNISWSEEANTALQDEVEKDLNNVLVEVANETKEAGFTEIKALYNAKSPEWDDDGIAICTGETFKVCDSRVLKFDKFFEIYYDVPYLSEIQEIKKTIYKWYLSYYVQNPITKKRILCSGKAGTPAKFTIKETKLTLLSEKEYDNLYDEFFWIKMYFDIKLVENNIKLKPLEYNKHLKKIMDLATLNFDSTGKYNKLTGTTTEDADHTHSYWVDESPGGVVGIAGPGSNVGAQQLGAGVGSTSFDEHPAGHGEVHNHWIDNWTVSPAKYGSSDGYFSMAPPPDEDKHHTHSINSELPLALAYINKIVKKKMKGLKQIYRKEDKEQAIGELAINASQNGMIPY